MDMSLIREYSLSPETDPDLKKEIQQQYQGLDPKLKVEYKSHLSLWSPHKYAWKVKNLQDPFVNAAVVGSSKRSVQDHLFRGLAYVYYRRWYVKGESPPPPDYWLQFGPLRGFVALAGYYPKSWSEVSKPLGPPLPLQILWGGFFRPLFSGGAAVSMACNMNLSYMYPLLLEAQGEKTLRHSRYLLTDNSSQSKLLTEETIQRLLGLQDPSRAKFLLESVFCSRRNWGKKSHIERINYSGFLIPTLEEARSCL